MGNKVSAVHGVKSDHFYDQGNAVNEIWVGDVEVISRLPFGDSDLEQAGWPPGDFPKIPWHHFIIPMQKRDEASNMTTEIPSWAKNEACCQAWNPKNGYLGMYMSISPCAAYFIGVAFLLLAFGTYFHFITCVSAAIFDWRGLRESSSLYADPPAIRRMAKRKLLSSLAQAFIVAALSILCLVLGLPAAAAGMRTMNAASFILINGLGIGIVATVGVVGVPLSFLWLTRKPRRVEILFS